MPTATVSDKVQDLNSRYRQRLEAIVSNKKLTDEGKRRKAVEVWADTVDRISELRQENDQALESERRKLQDRYTGPPKLSVVADANTQIANIASYRDALDRAEKAVGPALGMLIVRAHRIGDESQVRAGLAVAYERNDVNAINAHLEVKPGDEPDLQRLVDLSQATSLNSQMMAALHLAAPDPPFGLTPTGARRLLDSNDEFAEFHP